MSLKKHYKFNRKKSIKQYIKLIILVILMAAVLPTFLRYAYIGMSDATTSTALFSVKVNDTLITNETETAGEIGLLNVKDSTPKIDSGDTCYFEITIDPTATEVSISYSILVNLQSSSNLPEGTVIEKYEKYIYENNTETLDSTTNLNTSSANISEDVLLQNTKTALSSTSKVKYKFFCKIPFPIDIVKDTAYTVTPNISVEQYISQ